MLWILVAFSVASWVSSQLLPDVDRIRLAWLPSGVALAVLALHGPRYLPVLVLAVVVSEFGRWLRQPLPMLLSILHNTVPPLLAAYVYRRCEGRAEPRLSVRRFYALLLSALTLALGSASSGGLAAWAMQIMTGSDTWADTLGKFALASFFGAILVFPTWLVGQARARQPDMVRDMAGPGETILWVAVSVAIAAFVLLSPTVSYGRPVYLMTLPLLWGALRMPPLATTLSTAITILGLLVVASNGWFGFSPIGDWRSALYVILFLLAYSLVPLLVMSLTEDVRRGARNALQRARTDELTGLPNRVGFAERFALTLAHAPQALHALIYVDIDNFRIVNDVASHRCGDELIRALAGIVSNQLRQGDVLARAGGDEFIALLTPTHADGAAQVAERIRATIAAYRHPWADGAFNFTASIGVIHFDAALADYDALLAEADAACYSAKSAGGNRVVTASADPAVGPLPAEAMRWAARIEHAIGTKQFELHCQSMVPLSADDAVSEGRRFEVLLRMRDGDCLLAPGEFMGAVERFKLGPRLDRYVLEHVLQALEAHPDWRAQTRRCAINLTAASVEDRQFLDFVHERLARSSVAAECLCFEITEGSAVRDLGDARRFIEGVRALGCKVALDDFGTGFCSFAYLASLAVDYVKIDGSFVRDMTSSPLATAIVRSITDIARSAGFTTVAEAVESDLVREQLRRLGVDYAQGYVIDRPQAMPEYFMRSASARP